MKTLIAVPCFDMIHTGFVKSFIDLEKPDGTAYAFITNTLIYEARNMIAQKSIEEGFDRVLWLDSDMIIPQDALIMLNADMDTGKDFVCGLYFTRKPPVNPVVCDNIFRRVKEDGEVESAASSYINYPKDSLFEIAGAGFGCVMTSADLLKRLVERYGAPFTPMMGMGEDLSFCLRATCIGAKMYCDSRVKCGHIGQTVFDEEMFIMSKQVGT